MAGALQFENWRWIELQPRDVSEEPSYYEVEELGFAVDDCRRFDPLISNVLSKLERLVGMTMDASLQHFIWALYLYKCDPEHEQELRGHFQTLNGLRSVFVSAALEPCVDFLCDFVGDLLDARGVVFLPSLPSSGSKPEE